MDWRGRKYYCVSFDWRSMDMRIEYLKLIDGIRIHPYRNIPKQPDEVEERGFYQFLISTPIDCSEAVEYEFRKAERNDRYCSWKEIKRDLSKKYLDCCRNIGYEEELLTEKEFIEEYCHNCSSQRCEGIGTEWFDGCKFKDHLSK